MMFACIAMVLAGCSHRPRHTPEGVAPPDSLVSALAAVDGQRTPPGDLLAGDTATTFTVTRDGAILLALARNRSLAVERLNPAIAGTAIAEARAAFDPTVLGTVSYGRSNDQLGGSRFTSSGQQNTNESETISSDVRIENRLPTGTDVFLAGGYDRTSDSFTSDEYVGTWSVGVTQSLLRGAGTAVNLVDLRLARNNEAISQQQLRDFVIELIRQVEFAYWELVLAREAEAIRRFSVSLAEEQLRLNEIYLEVGEGVEGDVISARAARAARQADLIDARADIRRRSIDLIRLLNPAARDQYRANLDPVDPAEVELVGVDPAQSAALAGLYRADLAEAKLRLANRDLEVLRTANGLLPRLDAFASYGRRSLGQTWRGGFDELDEGEFDNYEIGANLEWQPLNRAARARDRRARFQQQQAEASILNLEQLIDADVYQAAVEVERQWQRIIATREAVDARREELRAVQAEYEVGLGTNLDVLTVQENLVTAQLEEVTARIRYIQGLTELYAREATLLDRRGIGVLAAGNAPAANATPAP